MTKGRNPRRKECISSDSTINEDTVRQIFIQSRASDRMSDQPPRNRIAEKIAGEIVLSDDPGATLRKWRTDFDASQTELAEWLDVSSSVISDYESGRRASPGIGVVRRTVEALLALDEQRGGQRIRQFERVLSAGFDSEIVLDLQEYAASIPLSQFYETIGATECASGGSDRISGHTVIDSIEAITRLTNDDFFRLYGQSTERVLVFTNVTRGESPVVAMRVVNPTPNAVLLHGIEPDELWTHAPELARIDGFSLGVCDLPLSELLEGIRDLPRVR